jgi:hypothetical protein
MSSNIFPATIRGHYTRGEKPPFPPTRVTFPPRLSHSSLTSVPTQGILSCLNIAGSTIAIFNEAILEQHYLTG